MLQVFFHRWLVGFPVVGVQADDGPVPKLREALAIVVLVAAHLTVQLNQLQKAAEILEMLKVQPHFQGPQGAATSSSTAAPACGLSDAFINTEDAHVSHEPMSPAAPAAPKPNAFGTGVPKLNAGFINFLPAAAWLHLLSRHDAPQQVHLHVSSR